MPHDMREGPSEGWILAGTLDGLPAYPALPDAVAGMPCVLRLACDLAHAGCRTIHVVWSGDGAPPALTAYQADERLRGARLDLVTTVPDGPADDAIAVLRADRIYQRDIPKQVIAAWKTSSSTAAVLAGAEHDALVVTDRAHAREIAGAVSTAGALASAVAALDRAEGTPPYLAFTARARDRRELRKAERTLVWSLRKAADGIASTWINRHLSLPMSWVLMRTPVHPNHVTIFCFCLAMTGGFVISRGGYLAGILGMLLVNLGSIIDGVDGELARLKFRFSRLGQWLDTLADDFGNVAYITGIAFNLKASGTSWAPPFALFVLCCFAFTQTTQYWLIARVYKSGDLAAIPWAYQSHDFLTSREQGFKATFAKMLKRDFALTVFVGFAILGKLDWILFAFSAGALSFTVVFTLQLLRNLGSIRAQMRAR